MHTLPPRFRANIQHPPSLLLTAHPPSLLGPPRSLPSRGAAAKFRHVFADPAKPEQCFSDLELSPITGDHNYIRGNNKFFAVSAKGGGGPVLVLPYSAAGKLPRGYPLINGHSGAVLDTAWNPFNDHMLATGSDDATVRGERGGAWAPAPQAREGSCASPSLPPLTTAPPLSPSPPLPPPSPRPPLPHLRRSSCGPSPRAA